MTDRELLELAAKAAGVEINDYDPITGKFYVLRDGIKGFFVWNPLTDDGDALRLAVRLRLDICHPLLLPQEIECVRVDVNTFETHADDPYAATRRAIVRAAAEIGREMK